MRVSSLYIKHTHQKGRGVFTKKPIKAGMVLEIAPVIVVSAADRLMLEKTILYHYIFSWEANELGAAVALGWVSIYNHASPANCEYTMDYAAQTITITSMCNIEAGDELTINYAANWDEQKPVWFKTYD